MPRHAAISLVPEAATGLPVMSVYEVIAARIVGEGTVPWL